MSDMIEISIDGTINLDGDREFTRLIGGFGENTPIITTKQISKLLGYSNSIVTRTISRNISHFVEGVDIIDLKNAMPERYSEIGYTKNAFNASKNIYVLSQAGFLLYLKFAEGDKSVELYKNFIEDYFKTKAKNIVIEKTIKEQIQELKNEKARIYGFSIMESDDIKRAEMFRTIENLTNSIVKLEKSLSEEEIIKKLQPKLDTVEKLTESKNDYDLGTFSKVLGIKDMGRNNFFKWLRHQGILMNNNNPYQQYSKYFKVLYVTNSFNGHINSKTLIKPIGIDFIIKRLIKDNKIIPKSIQEIKDELDRLGAE